MSSRCLDIFAEYRDFFIEKGEYHAFG